MNEDLQLSLEKIPDILDGHVEMKNANEPILLYEGNIKLKNETTEVELKGKVEFKWVLDYGLRFCGNVNDSGLNHFQALTEINKPCNLLIDEKEYGTCWLTKRVLNFGSNNDLHIEGKLRTYKEGQFDKSVDKVKFAIVNLRDFYGDTVKYREGEKIKTTNCRIVLKNKEYLLTLDINKAT